MHHVYYYSMHDSRSYLFVEQPLSLADRASRNFVAVTLVMKSHHFWLEIQSKTMQVLQSNAQWATNWWLMHVCLALLHSILDLVPLMYLGAALLNRINEVGEQGTCHQRSIQQG